MDPELLAVICLQRNLYGARSKRKMARVEDESLFLPKRVLPSPYINYKALFTYIYRAQENNWALTQWAYQSKEEDKTMDF